MQCGKFHFSLKCCAMFFHSNSVFGICEGKYNYKYSYSHFSYRLMKVVKLLKLLPLRTHKTKKVMMFSLFVQQKDHSHLKQVKRVQRKREAQEKELLEQAILCMKKESQEKQASKKPDDYDLFCQFITADIRSIQDPYIKRQTKINGKYSQLLMKLIAFYMPNKLRFHGQAVPGKIEHLWQISHWDSILLYKFPTYNQCRQCGLNFNCACICIHIIITIRYLEVVLKYLSYC